MSEYPQRKSPRLRGYDYSLPGGYFITVCTINHYHLFGKITDGKMHLNPLGDLAKSCWQEVTEHYPTTGLDEFVVMPNHMHAVIFLYDKPAIGRPNLGTIVSSYKAAVTRLAHRQEIFTDPIWQSRYHDHIIRDEKSLNMIREYVLHNPLRWKEDTFYSE